MEEREAHPRRAPIVQEEEGEGGSVHGSGVLFADAADTRKTGARVRRDGTPRNEQKQRFG